MFTGFLQDWVTLDGSGADAFAQAKEQWLDLGAYGDVVLWLEVRAVANPGAGNVTLSYETSPTLEPTLFQPMATVTLAASATPVITKVQLSTNPMLPLARWLRWSLTGTAAGAWSVTFRVHVMAQKGTTGGAYDPAALSLTGWWRASYAAAPWGGTASAGPSGSRSLTTAGADPTVGSALNGYDGADFAAQQLTTGLAGSSLMAAGAFSFWCLMQADTVVADPGVGQRYQGNGLFDDGGNTFVQVTLTAAGASLGLTAGGFADEVTAGCSTGTPHLVQARWDGTDLQVRIDSGAWSSTAAQGGPGATIDDLSNTIRVGLTAYANFDGVMWEMGFADTTFSDDTFDSIRSYVNARYALAL